MTRLLGKKEPFGGADFDEVLSPLLEPADEAGKAIITRMLQDLGLLSERASTNKKLLVLLSSFLNQVIRLKARLDRDGNEMVMGYPHD